MIQKHCGLTENNLVKSRWSGYIKQYQRKRYKMNENTFEEKQRKIKQGKMKPLEVLTKKRAICVKSMEVKNIIPG